MVRWAPFVALLVSATVLAEPLPWHRRVGPTPPHPWPGLAPPDHWPEEPSTPQKITARQFADALKSLCRTNAKEDVAQYAAWILKYSRQHGVDPFTVAAVVYRGSRCRARHEDKLGGGLGRISLETHARQIQEGWYRYWTREDGEWHPHELLFNRFPFNRRSLHQPEANVYFTAALLYIYKRQCRSIDAAVPGEPHRHYASHYIWGDRVLGARFEDLVLQARRRLLRLYRGPTPAVLARARFRDMPLFSPLDGVPRKISSGFRDQRPGGRRHRGIDFVSTYGEPIRAVADGVVVFAGIDHPRGGATNLGPKQARYVSRRRMGLGGLFVLVDHGNDLVSGYFHLAGYRVKQGTQVKAGQLIGFVGDTGIKESPPHLHFELRIRGYKIDPARPLRPYVVPRDSRRKRPEA